MRTNIEKDIFYIGISFEDSASIEEYLQNNVVCEYKTKYDSESDTYEIIEILFESEFMDEKNKIGDKIKSQTFSETNYVSYILGKKNLI